LREIVALVERGILVRLQTPEQQQMAMLKLFRGQESSYQHEGREPGQSQGRRRGPLSQLQGKLLTGELKAEKTFREVSEQFLRECEIMSDLVFTGTSHGDFITLDAKTGKVLYSRPMGGSIAGGVLSYAVNGKQYVAVEFGRVSSFFGGQRYVDFYEICIALMALHRSSEIVQWRKGGNNSLWNGSVLSSRKCRSTVKSTHMLSQHSESPTFSSRERLEL
jgi:hypothetical protein